MEEVRLEMDAGGVARIALARSDKHNAMSARMMAELEEAAETVAESDGIRVVVLEADGGTFCAGGDLAWMRAQFGMDRATRVRESSRIARALAALYALPQPLIGKVQGNVATVVDIGATNAFDSEEFNQRISDCPRNRGHRCNECRFERRNRISHALRRFSGNGPCLGPEVRKFLA